MKRLIIFLTLLALVLAGCGSHLAEDKVEFFYCREPGAYQFGTADGVIAPEIRNLTNSGDDLAYLLSIYLRGPQDTQLRSPFPAGCKLVAAALEGDTLTVVLDGAFTRLENLDLTLACACMARTCLGLTDAELVCIQDDDPAQEKTINLTIRRDQLLLEDLTALPTEANTDHN